MILIKSFHGSYLCKGTCRIQTYVYCAHLRCNRPACAVHFHRFCIDCISHNPTQGQYLEEESANPGSANEMMAQLPAAADPEPLEECVTFNTHDDTPVSNTPENSENIETADQTAAKVSDVAPSDAESKTWKDVDYAALGIKDGIKIVKVKLNIHC